jgi:hypothetical protein
MRNVRDELASVMKIDNRSPGQPQSVINSLNTEAITFDNTGKQADLSMTGTSTSQTNTVEQRQTANQSKNESPVLGQTSGQKKLHSKLPIALVAASLGLIVAAAGIWLGSRSSAPVVSPVGSPSAKRHSGTIDDIMIGNHKGQRRGHETSRASTTNAKTTVPQKAFESDSDKQSRRANKPSRQGSNRKSATTKTAVNGREKKPPSHDYSIDSSYESIRSSTFEQPPPPSLEPHVPPLAPPVVAPSDQSTYPFRNYSEQVGRRSGNHAKVKLKGKTKKLLQNLKHKFNRLTRDLTD